MTYLKPCPFCGGEGVVIKSTFMGFKDDFFHCVCLDCNTENAKFKCKTETEAIEAWNRRDDA